jgi:two-component system NarL family response regulator
VSAGTRPEPPGREAPAGGQPLRILLADDHALFRDSLRALLTAAGHEVVGSAADGLEALELARRLRPDLILMDIEMPGCDGLAATRLIKAEWPEATVAMLTVSAADADLFEAIKSGASGYLLKSDDSRRFLAMVADLGQGGAVLPPALAGRLLGEFARQARRDEARMERPTGTGAGATGATGTPAAIETEGLSPRQVEVLTLLSQGRTYAEIGGLLFISQATVRYHLGQIMKALHLRNRAQVIAYAARHGYGSPPTA